MAGGAGPETGTELERVVEALELLLRPPAGPGERDGAAGPGPELRPETLRSNAAALAERLRREPGWAALRGLRDAVLARSPALAAGAAAEAEPGWAVACGLLALLLCLRERLAALAAVPAARGPGPGAAPPPSADTLSVAQGRSVARALRAAVGLGLLPYLPPGVGQRPGPPAAPSVLPAVCGARLLTATTALTEVARHPALGSPLLARHLGLLLASLCLLGHGPTAHSQGVPEGERAWCREALRDILDRVYQPLAVRELLVLQGRPKQSPLSPGEETKPALVRAPAWLRRLCGQLLSERLMRPSGVQSVVRGIMEGTGGGAGAEAAAVDWRKCDMVAKILASCPQQCLSLEDYYRLVCPQILDLLHIQDKLTARQFQRVATTTLLTMVKEHPQLAQKYLLQPLLAPLLRCSETAELAVEDLSAGSVLVTEAELSSCVEDVLKVYVVGNDSSSLLLQSLQSVLGVVFSLYSFAKQNVSYLRSPCQEILLWFLEKSERDVSLSVLEGFAGLSSSVHVLHPRCRFCAGSEGGATIAVEETVSDEDEALYQKISSEQRHVEDLVELLSHCQKSGLAGDFFICCLKVLTHVAAEDEVTSNSDVEPGRSLLELEQYHAGQRRKLQVLQLVATLCESVSDTVFTDVAQVGHGKALGDWQLECMAEQALGHWALWRQWLKNSWRKLERPQEKQFQNTSPRANCPLGCEARRFCSQPCFWQWLLTKTPIPSRPLCRAHADSSRDQDLPLSTSRSLRAAHSSWVSHLYHSSIPTPRMLQTLCDYGLGLHLPARAQLIQLKKLIQLQVSQQGTILCSASRRDCQLQRQEGAAQQTSPYLCPWLSIESQESSLCVNQNSDLAASHLYFKQNLFPSLTKLKDICTRQTS